MIKIQNLAKKFDNHLVVNHINLAVENELLVFLGPNGAGKSTTIKMITGLLVPTHGSVEINGIDISREPLKAKQQFGLVLEQPFLYEKLKTIEFLTFIAEIYRVPHAMAQKRLESLSELFEITPYFEKLIQDVSMGNRRKIALIAAMIHDPEVLILDEPTAGLDPQAAHRLKELLKNFISRGKTVFMTTHTLDVAQQLADRIAIIHQGNLLCLDTPEGLFQQHPDANHNLEKLFLQLTSATSFQEYDQIWKV